MERLEPVQTPFAPGQREQGVDEPFLLFARCQGSFASRAERGVRGLPVVQRHLEQGPLPGQRGTQLV